MRTVPRDRSSKLMFFQTHVPKWAERAEELGLKPELVERLETTLADAKAAFTAQQQAMLTARMATARFNNVLAELSRQGSAVMHLVAALAKEEGVSAYIAASVSAPKDASPIGPPGTPYQFTAELQQIGTLTLRWKCKQPRGAVGTGYLIRRRLGGSGPFVHLAQVGKRRFVDETIPAGAGVVEYEVQAFRTTGAGDVARHLIHLGLSHPLPPAFHVGRAA